MRVQFWEFYNDEKLRFFINPKGRIPRVYPWMNVKFARRASSWARNMERCHGLARGVSTEDVQSKDRLHRAMNGTLKTNIN